MHHLLLVVHSEIHLQFLVNHLSLQGLHPLYHQVEDLHLHQEEQAVAVAFLLQWFQRKCRSDQILFILYLEIDF